jgi:hypothetical protein
MFKLKLCPVGATDGLSKMFVPWVLLALSHSSEKYGTMWRPPNLPRKYLKGTSIHNIREAFLPLV